MMDRKKNIIEKAVRAMLQTGTIKFKALSKCYGLVDFEVQSDIFTEKEFVSSVYDSAWNSCPARAVASELTDLIISGEIGFVPLDEG